MDRVRLALLLTFVFLALGLGAELLYVLWYRKRFQRELTASDDIERSVVSSALGSEPYRYGTSPPSKELLLYYLCCKNQTRIEPASGNDPTPPFAVAVTPVFLKPPPPLPLPLPLPHPPTPPETTQVEEEEDDEELEKFNQLCRFKLLYTIKEEEDVKTVEPQVQVASQDQEHGLESPPVEEADQVIEDEEDDAAVFSSASASSVYTTPSSSPLHLTTMD